MAGRTGIFWFQGPGDFAQRFSVAAEELEGKAQEVVMEVVETAEARMKEIIDAGGINPTKKGGPRRLSDEMYDSVGSNVLMNARGRVQAEFGFIKSPPRHTIFQERGTRRGITPMLAYATALEEAIVDFQNKIDKVQWFATSRWSPR